MSAGATPMSFFALLGLLERRAGGARIGTLDDAAEPVRLRHDPNLAFPTAEIAAISCLQGARPVVDCTFLGLTGTVSPLPEHLVEGWSQQEGHHPLHALFGLWQHRLLALLYRSCVKYSPSAEHAADGSDAWSCRLGRWGEGEGGTALPLWRRLRWFGELAQRNKSATSLRRLLHDLLGEQLRRAQVEVRPMTGGWQPLDATQHARLGTHNHRLGDSFVLGDEVMVPASRFDVVLGPLSREDYAWISSEAQAQQLKALVHLFVPQGVSARIRYRLQAGVHGGWPLQRATLGDDTYLGAPAGEHEIVYDLSVDGQARHG